MDAIEVRLKKGEAERDEKLDGEGRFDWENWLDKHKLQVFLGGLGVFLLGIGVLSALVLSSKNESSDIEILPAQKEEQAKEIFIHVAGAVEKPGLYRLSSGSRVNDALLMAGGLAAGADRQWFNKFVNLAQKLSDGTRLYFPYKGELSSKQTGSGQIAGEQTNIFTQEDKININTASVSQLDSLSGIGPAYAQRIIDHRPYASIEDIMKVPGIGPAIFAKIKAKISI